MRLRDIFLREGARDAEHRRRAREMVQAILRETERPPDDQGEDTAGPYVAWSLRGTGDELLERAWFALQTEKGSPHAWYVQNGQSEIITLSVPEASEGPRASIKKHEDKVAHELIHLIDAHRHKDPSYAKAPSFDTPKVRAGDEEERQKYYNTPMEYNAHLQQALYSIEHGLQKMGVRNQADAKRVLGVDDASQFAKKLLGSKQMQEFTRMMSPETRRKVLKRLAQFWDELV